MARRGIAVRNNDVLKELERQDFGAGGLVALGFLTIDALTVANTDVVVVGIRSVVAFVNVDTGRPDSLGRIGRHATDNGVAALEIEAQGFLDLRLGHTRRPRRQFRNVVLDPQAQRAVEGNAVAVEVGRLERRREIEDQQFVIATALVERSVIELIHQREGEGAVGVVDDGEHRVRARRRR